MQTRSEDAFDAAPAISTAGGELIDFLQRRNNPFDDYVHASHSSRRVPHVASVHGDVAELLRRAIDRYCLDWRAIDDGTEQDVLWSGVIVVDGRRGDGKTHLLQNGLRSANGVVVQPTSFDSFRPFREYLLRQLVDRLQDEPSHRSSLVDLAQWFTRKLLARAIRTMPELDWICLCQLENGSGGWWNPMSTAPADRWLSRRNELLEELEDAGPQPIEDICEVHRQSPAFLRRLGLGHLRRMGEGRTAAQKLRARIHAELVETAFDTDRLEVFDALLGGSSTASDDGESTLGRTTLVDERLACLVELFLLFGRPITFAFDGMEALLGDPPDKQKCQTFLNGIAQVIDTIPGIPLLVFAEGGHWNRVLQEGSSSYASQRFERGIPVPGRGAVSRLKLARIDREGLTEIVAARMRGQHDAAGFAAESDADRIVPLTASDLDDALGLAPDGSTPALRVVLQRVRSRYEAVVYGRSAEHEAVPPPTPTDPEPHISTEELENVWDREVGAAERRTGQRSLLGLSDRLIQGVRIWLDGALAEGLTVGDWRLSGVEVISFGNDMRYGECVVANWVRGDDQRRQALAFLLAGGPGMPADLRTKVSMISSSERVADSMVVLWPRREAVENAAAVLPGVTSEVWEEFAATPHGRRVRLCSVETTRLAPWIALSSIQRLAIDELGVSAEVLAHFAHEKLEPLRQYLTPDQSEASQ